jgi:hypothetical protein
MFPEGLDGMAQGARAATVPLHYAVLRPDLATCLPRVGPRRPGDPDDLESFARLHARFADLGEREANIVEATGTPEETAAAVLAGFSAGRLKVVMPPLGLDGQDSDVHRTANA